ncbi:MAG: UPF0182 family protein [Deltaproteobacteria bacterium]|nr:UPF0182 family protein [Deltaproteobacteria bacterium]
MAKDVAPEAGRTGRLAWTIGLSYALGAALLAALIYMGGAWYFAANTRLLDPMIGAGIIKYHDKGAGFIEGVPDLDFYLMSQDPVRWDLALLVVGIFLLFFFVKAAHFHNVAHLWGIKSTLGKSAGVYGYGVFVEKFFPMGTGETATAMALQANGAPAERAKAVLFTEQLSVLFQTTAFALLALLATGWAAWLAQLFWGLFVLWIAYLFLRAGRRGEPGADLDASVQRAKVAARVIADRPLLSSWVGLLGLIAFGMEDVAAYLIAMAFSSANVVLHVDPTMLLMAIVASYLARFICVTPGGIGQFEWGFAAALWVGGVAFHECVTIAILDNVFRYVALAIFFAVTQWREGANVRLRDVLQVVGREDGPEPPDLEGIELAEDAPAEVPRADLGRILPPSLFSSRLLWGALILVGLFFVDKLSLLLFDYWLLDSLGYLSVFWTNFWMGAMLFLFGFFTMAVIAVPAFAFRLPRRPRNFVVAMAVLAGCLGGYFLSLTYQNFLLANGIPFGQTDPVFGNDLGFYIYNLPAIWVAWRAVVAGAVLGLLSALGCAYYAGSLAEGGEEGVPGLSRVRRLLGLLTPRGTLIALAWAGLLVAVGQWLTRYDLLFKDNEDMAVFVGAAYVDVVGFFTHLNYVWVTSAAILGVTALVVLYLHTNRQVVQGTPPTDWQ